MAHRRLESVFDLARSRLDVLVTCRACGRRAVFDPEQVIAYFSARAWHLGLPQALVEDLAATMWRERQRDDRFEDTAWEDADAYWQAAWRKVAN